ncbi:MAG: hypothetical protein LBC12_07560 [Nitrososphaerota archaeon]|jgi:hypothetical protein|nr:hypothetical protein [Nitrososphaerota archaeon]
MIYDPKTDIWSVDTRPSIGKLYGVIGVTTGVYAPQRVYVLSENSTSGYDTVNDVWSTAKAIRTPRFSFGVAVVDDVL